MQIIMIALMTGCGEGGNRAAGSGGSNYVSGSGGGTPSARPHNIEESDDGITGMHAKGYETPYLCLDAGGGTVTCPDDVWPDTSELSCDAAGCHGSYTFDPAVAQNSRSLDGAAGPSCYTCHDNEWNSTKDANAVGNGGEEEEDDD